MLENNNRDLTLSIISNIATDWLEADLITYAEYSRLEDSVEILPDESDSRDTIVDERCSFEGRLIAKKSIGKPTPLDFEDDDNSWAVMRGICRNWAKKGLINEEEFHNLLAF